MEFHLVEPSTFDSAPARPCTTPSVCKVCGPERLAAHVYKGAPGAAIPHPYDYHDAQCEAAATAFAVEARLGDDGHTTQLS